MYTLYIQPDTEDAKTAYAAIVSKYLSRDYAERDAGFDLVCDTAIVPLDGRGVRLNCLCKVALFNHELNMFQAYCLLPRSSISKTTLRLANSVGLIDAGYRGTLLAAVDNHSQHSGGNFKVNFGDRYFQLITPNLLPFDKIEIVDTIPGGATFRGEGGFGSTGK